jgi:aspartate ammonia-lyase
MELIAAIVSIVVLIIIVTGINTISTYSRKSLKVLNEIAKQNGVDPERLLEINDPDLAYKRKLKHKQQKSE